MLFRSGAMAVQTNSPVVREVIRTAGLHRLWSLVESREQGLQKLGINDTGVRVVPTRWTIGPGVTAIASLLLSALTWKGPGEWRFWAGCGTLLMGSLAVFLSRRAIAKAEQGQRALGVLSLLVGLGSVAAGAFFVWPRSDLDAKLVDPERAAGVRVDDPQGFGEPSEVSEGITLPDETAPASPANQPPQVAPTKPATQSESLPGPALPHPTQPASPSGSPTPPPASPDHDSVEPVSDNSTPDSPPVTPGERPEAPFEPVDHENTP